MSGSGAVPVKKPVDSSANCISHNDASVEKCAVIAPKKVDQKVDGFAKAESGDSKTHERPNESTTWMVSATRRFSNENQSCGIQGKDRFTQKQFDQQKQNKVKISVEVRPKGIVGYQEIPLNGVIALVGREKREVPLCSGYRKIEISVANRNSRGEITSRTLKTFFMTDAQYKIYQDAIQGKNGLFVQTHEENYEEPEKAKVPHTQIAKVDASSKKPLYKQSVGSLKAVPSPETEAAPSEKKEDELGRLIRESDEKWRTNRGKTDDSASTPGENRMKPFISEKANEWKTRPSAE